MAWKRTVAKGSVSSNRLEWVGGGDADIYSKPGRRTRVTLEVSNIRPAENDESVLVDVFYSVKEMRKNYTFLRWSTIAELPIPLDAVRHKTRVINVRGYDES